MRCSGLCPRRPHGWFGLLRVLSCGNLKLLRDVTGKALCSAVVEFVAPWFYGFGTVLDFINGWFSRWESSGPARVGGRSFAEFQRCSSHVQESQSARRGEKSTPLARRFKTVQLGPARGRLVESDCPYGAEPPPPPMSRLSGGGIYVVRHSSHSVEDINLQILYACLVTHDAKA